MGTIPVDTIYKQRQGFVIVALTGITGSGCSKFAELMATPFKEWALQNYVRSDNEIAKMLYSDDKQEVVFARKYLACYNVCNKQYDRKFEIIHYRDILILYTLRELVEKYQSYEDTLNALGRLVSGKFGMSFDNDPSDIRYDVDTYFSSEQIASLGFTPSLFDLVHNSFGSRTKLWQLYSAVVFVEFCKNLYKEMKKRDYYSKNFFVHRLACSIRATGGCESTFEDNKKSDNSHVFCLVELINEVIKGYHEIDKDAPRRFVIDSIRNSLEILYLRERYNAFYMIALHNDGNENATLNDKLAEYIKDDRHRADVCKNIMELSKAEKNTADFEDGYFYAPDLSRCVTESEIHISFYNNGSFVKTNKNKDLTLCSFYSYGEQWMKFYALIMRPGLITPTRDERCMSMAYVAKFNSGCISRQVGCTIVDGSYAVQSIGWNDPPSPQLPCNLRYADELIDDERRNSLNGAEGGMSLYRVYSKFESDDKTKYKVKDKDGNIRFVANGFCDCMNHEIRNEVVERIHSCGLPYCYCFRSRYNTYKGQKDQVNTRSLHAEENTMLQISSRGGVGLKGGTMYVTASPCVLCSKKAYQIGIRDIVYLDPYTDIAPDLILSCGFNMPNLRPFRGAIGGTFYKLYQPFMPYKDELAIYEKVL